MNNDDPVITNNRNAEDYGGYQYYEIRGGGNRCNVPVRVVLDKDGDNVGADTIDPKTGNLIKNAGLINEATNGRSKMHTILGGKIRIGKRRALSVSQRVCRRLVF